jgi:hypothetical protein
VLVRLGSFRLRSAYSERTALGYGKPQLSLLRKGRAFARPHGFAVPVAGVGGEIWALGLFCAKIWDRFYCLAR